MLKNSKKYLSLLLAGTMLAGCGGGAASSGTTTSTAGADATAAAAASSTEGQTVVVAFDADLNTMDHHIATDGNSFIMQSMCMSGLTQLDEGSGALASLAETWDVSDDGLTYTFHIAEDAKWSNGTDITANDFVYGWQRLADPDTASEYAFILSTIHVVNADAVQAGEMDVTELGVEAADDKTFVVHLDLPCGFLLGLMAFPSFFPLNQEFYESVGDQYSLSPDDMIYSGPYEMTGWEQGNEYTFTKRADYFDVDENAADTVVFKFIQDTQSAMLSYQNGDIDVVKLQGEQVDMYSGEEGFTNRLQGYLWYLSLNFESANVADAIANDHLRAALSYAIDRDTLATSVLKDGSIGAAGIIPQDLSSGPDGVDFRETNGVLVSYDPDKAAEEYKLAVEELGGDVTFELLFEDSEASKAVAENLQSMFQTNCPGLTVTLNSKPKKTRLELMNNQEYDVALTRWGPDYADPQTYLDLYVSTNTSNNSGRYNSAAYDELVAKGTTGEDASDETARWVDLLAAEQVLIEQDHGVIPVYQNGGAMMINPKVTGINFHSAGVDDYRHVTKSE